VRNDSQFLHAGPGMEHAIEWISMGNLIRLPVTMPLYGSLRVA
jgi:hypothetical protein